MEQGTDPLPGGLHGQALVCAVLEQFLWPRMIIALLVGFRNRHDRQGGLAREMPSGAYTVYLVHAPALALITLAIRNLTVFPLLKVPVTRGGMPPKRRLTDVESVPRFAPAASGGGWGTYHSATLP